MPRAKYVFHDYERIIAVYDNDVPLRELASTIRQLMALPGVHARATRAALQHPDAPPIPIIWMGVLPQYNPLRALNRLRELVDPEYPIAIETLDICYTHCVCGKSSHDCTISYIPCFDPEDEESFKLHLLAALQRLDFEALWDEATNNTALLDALAAVLPELGAYATHIHLAPRVAVEKCSHTSS